MQKVSVRYRPLHAMGSWLIATGLTCATPLAWAQEPATTPGAAAPAPAAPVAAAVTTTTTTTAEPTPTAIAAVPMIPVADTSKALPTEALAGFTPPPSPEPPSPPVPVRAERNSLAVFWIPTIRLDERFDDPNGGRAGLNYRGRNGFGTEFRAQALPFLFVTGAYRRNTLDAVSAFNGQGQSLGNDPFDDGGNFHIRLQDARAGLGVTAGDLPLYLRGEYVYNRLDIRDGAFPEGAEHHIYDGWSALVGGTAALNRYLGVRGEAGWHDQRGFGRGVEYRAGLDIFLYKNLSLTGDWRVDRRNRIRSDADVDHDFIKIQEGIVGLRLLF